MSLKSKSPKIKSDNKVSYEHLITLIKEEGLELTCDKCGDRNYIVSIKELEKIIERKKRA